MYIVIYFVNIVTLTALQWEQKINFSGTYSDI